MEWDSISGIIEAGTFTVTWHNTQPAAVTSTRGPCSQASARWSGDHNVYSKHGYIEAYAFGAGSTLTDDGETSCTFTPKPGYFDD